MEQLECPSDELWEERRAWFEALFDIENRPGNCYFVGEHSSGLLVELQSIYCAGAFIGSLIVACTIIDAHLREVELGGDFSGGIKSAFETSRFKDDLNWLRLRRNRLIHFSDGSTPISVDDHYTNREAHEFEARRAIALASEVLFENPGS